MGWDDWLIIAPPPPAWHCASESAKKKSERRRGGDRRMKVEVGRGRGERIGPVWVEGISKGRASVVACACAHTNCRTLIRLDIA